MAILSRPTLGERRCDKLNRAREEAGVGEPQGYLGGKYRAEATICGVEGGDCRAEGGACGIERPGGPIETSAWAQQPGISALTSAGSDSTQPNQHVPVFLEDIFVKVATPAALCAPWLVRGASIIVV
jgi:hypothetical protein